MGDRGNVRDRSDLQTGGLQGTDGRLTARPRPFHKDVDLLYPLVHSLFGRLLSGYLRGVWSTLPRPLKPHRPRTTPGNGITLLIGDGNDGIIKCRLHVSLPIRNVFTFPASPSFPSTLSLCHCTPSSSSSSNKLLAARELKMLLLLLAADLVTS